MKDELQSVVNRENAAVGTQPPVRRARRRLLVFVGLVAAAGVLAMLVFGAIVQQQSNQFLATGKFIMNALDQFGRSAQKKDFKAIEDFYASDFLGESLGLNNLAPIGEKDGIRQLRWSSKGAADKQAAMAEWRDYLGGFQSIEEFGMHIDRLEEWHSRDRLTASIRFELIGTPVGASQAGIDRGYLRMTFNGSGGQLRVERASPIQGERLIADKPQFLDVGKTAGIDFKNQYYPGFLNQELKFSMLRYGPAGITTADYDNDGFYDLFIPDGVESKLFRNRGDGTFEDVTAKAGLSGLDGVSTGIFADYDNDGYKDLFVSHTFRPNQLFHNNGNGTFTDVTKKAGLGEECCTTVASWADYDNDGLLDLYVGRYLDPRKNSPPMLYARNGEPNVLYHNNGNGTFTDVTEKAGVGEIGLCLGSVWGDLDDDGYPELYVVNDFGRKTLYHNNRNGTFTDVTVSSHTLDYGAGMNASMADYDNDGKLDLYVTNIRSDVAWLVEPIMILRYMQDSFRQGVWKTDMPLYYQIFRQSGFDFLSVFRQMASGNTLMRNKGDMTFEDTTLKANANPVGWYWGASFADFDNDGWLDIYTADGWVYGDRGTDLELEFFEDALTRQKEFHEGKFFDPKFFANRSWHGWERNRHLRNNGDGTFLEIGRGAGTDLLLNSRGVAVADFWNRGVLDIAVSASVDRHALLRNEVGGKRNWLGVELVGTKSNRDAVGARVSIVVNGKPQMREVVLGDGYGSQNSLRQYFGIGDATRIDQMTVRWPRSGITQKFENVSANQIVEVREGENIVLGKRPTPGRK
jgi:ASPIC and UnbV/FG-GAP-like repeat